MITGGVEDEEKWLAAGITGLQQNAFYMHRALVLSQPQITRPRIPISWIYFLRPNFGDLLPGFQQSQGCIEVFGSDAVGASNFETLASQILRTVYACWLIWLVLIAVVINSILVVVLQFQIWKFWSIWAWFRYESFWWIAEAGDFLQGGDDARVFHCRVVWACPACWKHFA